MGKTKKEKKSHSVAYELFGWLVYIAIIVGSDMADHHICGTENQREWSFYGDDAAGW